MQGGLIKFKPGMSVRHVNNPNLKGIVCEGEPILRGNRVLLRVNFGCGEELTNQSYLENDEGLKHPLDLLKQGELGGHNDLRRTLTHARFSGRLANVIYSMEATNTEFHAHQFKPVIKMCDSPSNSLLIADEVGLGKTIEAGLIWIELRSRHNLNKLLVLCPSSLCEKWKFELEDKMRIQATICNTKETLKILKNPNKRESGFAIIASMQGLRPPRVWREEHEDEDPKNYASKSAELARFLDGKANDNSLIDLLIIDEAHHMRNHATQTNKLGQLMQAVSEYLVFLSATPVHNSNSDLLSLLNLLDADMFPTKYEFEEMLNANAPLVKARDEVLIPHRTDASQLKVMLEEAQKHELLKNSQQLKELMGLITDEKLKELTQRSEIAHRLETVNLLSNTITRTRKRDVHEWRVTREVFDGSIKMEAIEEEFYNIVTKAIRNYAQQEGINESFVLAMPQRQMTSCMAAAFQSWKDRIFDDEQAMEEEVLSGEDGSKEKSSGELTKVITERIRINDSITFDELRNNDSKYKMLERNLDEYITENPNEKIIIFSAFRGTLAYLQERLNEYGIDSLILQGGSRRPKGEIIQEFQESDTVKILLSSEVGGEGVDLQFCRIIVNYDLPWNPMRLEQRIGRIDRFGQKADKILILNLLNEGTIDEKIYRYLYKKLELCRDSIGEFEAVLSKGIKKFIDIYLTTNLTREQEYEQINQTQQAIETNRQNEKKLEDEAIDLIAHGDYILRQVNAARDMKRWIDKHDLLIYTKDFLIKEYPGCNFFPKDEEKYEFEISLSQDAQYDLDKYIKKLKIFGQTQLCDGLPKLCRFENKMLGKWQKNIEIISQFHPLIRFITQCISDNIAQNYPAVALKLAQSSLQKYNFSLDTGIYILVISLWSVEGVRHSEKFAYGLVNYNSGENFDEDEAEKLAWASTYYGKQWLEVKKHCDLDDAWGIANNKFEYLNECFEEFFRHEKAKNEDRAEIQERNLNLKKKRFTENIEKTLETNRARGQVGLIKANEVRLHKLENKYSIKMRSIEDLRKVTEQETEICIGIILIE